MRQIFLWSEVVIGMCALGMCDGLALRVVKNFTAYVNNFPHEKI